MTYHMRRKDKEVTDPKTLKRILKTTKYVTVAMAKDNQPYLVSLSHGYDEARNCLYFHCAKEGKKLDYLKANNSVWGQALIDEGYMEGECNHRFTTVQFSGRVTSLTDPEEKLHAMRVMMRQLESNPEPMIGKLSAEKLEKALIGRIDIAYMSGKKPEEPQR